MDEFQSEKEQIDEIKQWWKANGSFIITGLVLGVGVLSGWKYWNHFHDQRAAAASAQYEELAQAIATNDRVAATDILGNLEGDFAATPYASQAALAMAKLYVQSDEPVMAAEQLRNVVDTAKDDHLRLVARLRLARVLLSQERADEALETLVVADPGSFAARFHEVRGDVFAALDRNAEARVEYQSALDKFEPGLFDRQLVEMKLNNLAGTSSDVAPVTEPDA
ncbi:MAG: tetratricopeptide repeat protein [Gammaproteobacteria bacterium]|nr:tetratricopeptide repeat protein [Gammaproteobacteria bacterium]MDH3768338.1 tetratricopeptide repeat protein [Gammaproteobacteria bacterium]